MTKETATIQLYNSKARRPPPHAIMNQAHSTPTSQPIGPLTKSRNKPGRGPTISKSTTTSHIALSSSLAEAASEVRKHKQPHIGKDLKNPKNTR